MEALKARNTKCRPKIVVIVLRPKSFRAFSAKKPQLVPPGPMAQAIRFRAFGAGSPSFDTASVAPDASVNLNDAAVFRLNIDFDNRRPFVGCCHGATMVSKVTVDASIRRYRARFCKRSILLVPKLMTHDNALWLPLRGDFLKRLDSQH